MLMIFLACRAMKPSFNVLKHGLHARLKCAELYSFSCPNGLIWATAYHKCHISAMFFCILLVIYLRFKGFPEATDLGLGF